MKFLKYLAMIALYISSGCVNYTVKKDLSYDKSNVPFGVFDMYEPLNDNRPNRPVVIAIHGGAWEGGSKRDMDGIAAVLCPKGYVVLSPDYRVTTDGTWGKGSPWPAQIDDLYTATKYFKANADLLRIDPNRIASLGVSAGGHLATMLAVRPDPATGQLMTHVAVDLDGEMDMTKPGDQVMYDFDGIMTYAMGHPKPWALSELEDISPVHFASKANPAPSLLIIHGQYDTNVYVANAQWIEDAMNLNPQKPYVLKYIITGKDGACHGRCWEVPAAKELMLKFLAEKIGK